MIKQPNTRINIKLWRDGVIGVLLSSAGMFLGWNLGSVTAGLLGGEPSILAQVGKGLVWGVVIALMQWFIVRSPGVPIIRFLVASAVGFAVGYPLGQRIVSMMDLDLSWKLQYVSALTIYGLSLTVPQWWIFRRHMKRANLWILFSMIGWAMAGVAWLRFGVNTGMESIAYGIVAGPGLVWLVHSPRTNEVV
jgi:xanthosine utilization system XapX-like protein